MKSFHFKTIDSTNTYLKNNYESLDNYTFVSSDVQTKGHGRNNRVWYSNGQNLYFSLLIKDESLFEKIHDISLITAYSIIEVLNIDELKIKWPNDILYKDRKLCGILLESICQEKMECLIIGVGLNVNQKEFRDDYLIKPISLLEIENKTFDIGNLKERIYSQLIHNLELIKQEHNFFKDIEKLDYLKEKEAYALINSNKEKIKVLGINSDYSLKIEFNDTIKDLQSGEISFHI